MRILNLTINARIRDAGSQFVSVSGNMRNFSYCGVLHRVLDTRGNFGRAFHVNVTPEVRRVSLFVLTPLRSSPILATLINNYFLHTQAQNSERCSDHFWLALKDRVIVAASGFDFCCATIRKASMETRTETCLKIIFRTFFHEHHRETKQARQSDVLYASLVA